MKAALLIIGDEVLSGETQDTNSYYAGGRLAGIDVELTEILTVADTKEAITRGLNYLFEHTDLVISTGGLGPTRDDVTKETIAGYFGREMVMNDEWLKTLQARYRERGRDLNKLNESQAMVPQGAEILPNEVGTAPIMWLEGKGKTMITLPGVPHEMRHNLDKVLLPRIKEKFSRGSIQQRTLMAVGIAESDLAIKLKDVDDAVAKACNKDYYFKLAYLPALMTIKLQLTGRGPDEAYLTEKLGEFAEGIKEAAGEFIFSEERETLYEYLNKALTAKNKTLATIESCTGGSLASGLIANPGSSKYFIAGLVSYANETKIKELGVKPETIEKYGAVSEQTVSEMLTGGLKRYGTDIVLATSGLAGPTGGTEEKPVGTLWYGVATKDGKHIVKTLRFNMKREQNMQLFGIAALDLLRRVIADYPDVKEGDI